MQSLFKKISICLLIIFFAVFLGQTTVKAVSSKNIIDDLDYLTDSEILTLQSDIDNIIADYNLEAVVVITDETEGKSSRDFADDFYDYGGYGVDGDYSGLLMLINMAQREVWISTTGRAIDIFTDSRISTMVKNVTTSLSKGSYYEACTTFIRDVKSYAKMGVPAGQHRVDEESVDNSTYFQRVLRLMKSFYVYLIAIAVALIATLIASSSSEGKVTINSGTYEEAGSFELSASRDDFIRESTTRTVIETNTNSSSNSTTHRGSSGRSHGGGGGGF
ncbi:TPM domain-containing protein [Clostridium thermarum]|uniref:TPM domain-containing protein n=1 Tax=Clostridium thermarum TaxID=1716543 RepID=UPI001FAB55C6|nr:TPM domain-containing protein [Clostridium thermarum]